MEEKGYIFGFWRLGSHSLHKCVFECAMSENRIVDTTIYIQLVNLNKVGGLENGEGKVKGWVQCGFCCGVCRRRRFLLSF